MSKPGSAFLPSSMTCPTLKHCQDTPHTVTQNRLTLTIGLIPPWHWPVCFVRNQKYLFETMKFRYENMKIFHSLQMFVF